MEHLVHLYLGIIYMLVFKSVILLCLCYCPTNSAFFLFLFPYLFSCGLVTFGYSYLGFLILVLSLRTLPVCLWLPRKQHELLAYHTCVLLRHFTCSPDNAKASQHFHSIYIPPHLNITFACISV